MKNLQLISYKTKCFCLEVQNKGRMPSFSISSQHCAGGQGKGLGPTREGKKNERNADWKEVILFLFADGMIVYVVKPKESTKNVEYEYVHKM